MPSYPEEHNGGNLLLKIENNKDRKEPLECQRVMMHHIRPCPKVRINQPEDVVNIVKEMNDYDRERGIILHLDTKNYVIGIENISTGSLNQAIIHPREAVKGAILNNSANVIFVHNHPSGDPFPSREDIDIDNRLKQAFNTMGIKLLDSIIIGKEGKYYSAKDTSSGQVMETNEIIDDDICTISVEAAMSVISEKCKQEGDEDAIPTLERESLSLIRKLDDKSEQSAIRNQIEHYVIEKDAQGLLYCIKYLKAKTD